MVLDQLIDNEELMEFELTVAAELSKLPLIREFIHNAAIHACPHDQFSDDLVLAVDELVTNIIVHGYQGDEGVIRIFTETDRNGIEIILNDNANVFDPTIVELPDINRPLEERPIGGLGIFMAKILTDKMVHRSLPDGGNELRLYKRCPDMAVGSAS